MRGSAQALPLANPQCIRNGRYQAVRFLADFLFED
jgi:hypothetical protein